MKPPKCIPPLMTVIVQLLLILNAIEASVFTYKYNIGNIPTTSTSSLLAWEEFNDDPKQLQFAVHAGTFHSLNPEENHAVYVCRAIIEGIMSTGTTAKQSGKTLCINSMHTSEHRHHAFELLVNRGHGAKLKWERWSKFSGSIPVGSVCVADGHNPNTYVARHQVKHDGHHHIGSDYIVGRYDPSEQFGKIFVTNDNEETIYEDGDILTEIEPAYYEIHKVRQNKFRGQQTKNLTLLGESILSNPETEPTEVDTIISYMYDKEFYYGTYEGMVRGLNATVFENNGNISISWGFKESIKTVENTMASAILQPGTALNVTVKGNYTITDSAYTADVTIYYVDKSEPQKRRIESYLRKAEMLNVKMSFSPIYWIHNQTFVPTTTTTTTTTTSTTQATTTSREPKPISSPVEEQPPHNMAANEVDIDQSGGSQEITIGKQKIKVGSLASGSSNDDQTKKDPKSGSDRAQLFINSLIYTIALIFTTSILV